MKASLLILAFAAGLWCQACNGGGNPASASRPGSILLRITSGDTSSTAQAIARLQDTHSTGRKDPVTGLAKVVSLGMTISLDGVAKVTRNVTSGNQETATIADVAAGSHTISVTFDDRQGGVLYSGQTTLTVTSGQQAQATLAVTPQNRKDPTVSFTLTPLLGTPSTTFSGDASASSDVHDAIEALQIRWDWGDGTASTGRTATHQYATGGVKTVRVTVTNSGARSTFKEQTVSVAELPKPTMLARVDKNSVISGDKLIVTISAVGMNGLTGFTAEVLYDLNAVADPTVSTRLVGATAPLKASSSITTIPGYSRITDTGAVQLTANPYTGFSDLAAFEFTAKPGYKPTNIGIRRLILRAGTKADTILPTPSPLVLPITVSPQSGTRIAASLNRISGVNPGDKFMVTISATGVVGITGYTAEVIYDGNAVSDPVATARLTGAVSPGAFPETFTQIAGFNRRMESPGAQLPPSPYSGNTDIATFEFTAKSGFTTTGIGIRRLILRAGAKADTIAPSPSPMVLQVNP